MKRNLLKLSALLLMITMALTAISQTIKDYRIKHRQLLAKQERVIDKIKVEESINYSRHLYGENNESDIYTEGWESGSVNAYKDATIPQTKNINIVGYHMPVKHRVVNSHFGYRKSFGRMHRGVDLKANIGDTIYAAFNGKVRLTKFDRDGYGFYVVVRHDNGMETVYGHLSKFLVKQNQYVRSGQPIALSGNTGRSTGPHLHFETRYMGIALNPEKIFDFVNGVAHKDVYVFNKGAANGDNKTPSNVTSNKPNRNKKRR